MSEDMSKYINKDNGTMINVSYHVTMTFGELYIGHWAYMG